jgi:hypothetical protein
VTRAARIGAGGEVFGPSVDALVRRIDTRITPAERPGFAELVETWPENDADALYHRLTALLDGLPPPSPPPGREPGSAGRGILGAVIGGFLGFPLGFLVYMVLRETVISTSLWSSDGLMWSVVLVVMLACAAIGGSQGRRPSRAGHALLRAILGFVLGATFCAIAGMLIAFTLGELLGVSQMEGAFAMGVVFTIGPIAGLLGGIAVAIWWGSRAWRRWARV